MNQELFTENFSNYLAPTFKNVSEQFITVTMRNILLSFNFKFREPEGVKYVEDILKNLVFEYGEFFSETFTKVMNAIKSENTTSDLPTLIINNYKLFFELLRQYYEKFIELYLKNDENDCLSTEKLEDCFEHIWLRATSEDFNNPENFLQRQVQIINDTTFTKYDYEFFLGSPNVFDNHILCVKNEVSKTWDETPQEFRITLYDKNYDSQTDLNKRPHYMLPVIRYGIYIKNGKKICVICAIQSKKQSSELSKEVLSVFNNERTDFNKDVIADLKKKDQKNDKHILNVEPSHIIALSMFINFLHNGDISEIEVPNMYVLDYAYHQKNNLNSQNVFDDFWTKEMKQRWPQEFLKSKQILEDDLKDADMISKNKTERFIYSFMRLMYHYPNSEINSYPGELDSFFHISIPVVKDEKNIKSKILRELFTIVNETYTKNSMSK